MAENKAYENFSDPPKQLITSENQNSFDIYCPDSSCKGLILRANHGILVERPKEKLRIPDEQAYADLKTNGFNIKNDTSSSQLQGFWQLTDMMAFENIGFSKTIIETGIKYLCCAYCNAGPLGYHDTTANEKEYLIAINRARKLKQGQIQVRESL
ncbi:8653_t:CDS:2 [Diversispora eburnea]|uniref:8653_t:CDS:1 n=1 Tax=Diversispora eburnea TaxID=1213867 RepID=A0A9N9BVZ0_9GLOM|nr:8653_t:CDS:2 [Diversispora eburnea]